MSDQLTSFVFFFNDTATTEIYTLSLRDALPIYEEGRRAADEEGPGRYREPYVDPREVPEAPDALFPQDGQGAERSEEHTSELQSRQYLVCRLLLEKKKTRMNSTHDYIQYAVLLF